MELLCKRECEDAFSDGLLHENHCPKRKNNCPTTLMLKAMCGNTVDICY